MGIPLALGRGCGRIGSKRLGISNRKNAGLTFCCIGKWYWGSSKNIEQFSKSCIVLIIDSYIKDIFLQYWYQKLYENGRSWSEFGLVGATWVFGWDLWSFFGGAPILQQGHGSAWRTQNRKVHQGWKLIRRTHFALPALLALTHVRWFFSKLFLQ